jgi:hypothetical protein
MIATASQDVTRPLSVLKPLICQELADGEAAGMEHYRRAGALLVEAKEQVPRGEWLNWITHNFRLSQQTANLYMKLAEQTTNTISNYSSLGDFVRKTSNPNFNKPYTVRPTPWHEPVKQAVDSVSMERMTRAMQAREAEARMTRELGLKLIDIGYKVLSTKLHPDTGGSTDAMKRLNRVRDQLKKAL